MKIIHTEEECIEDIARCVRAAKEDAEEGLAADRYIPIRFAYDAEAIHWVKALEALVFWMNVECLGTCTCKSAWGRNVSGRQLPVSVKVLLD